MAGDEPNKRDELVIANMRYAETVARKMWKNNHALRAGCSVEDAMQAAIVGLISAAERYDASHASGAKFRSYALRRIKGEVIDALRETGFLIKRPRRNVGEDGYAICETQQFRDEEGNLLFMSNVPTQRLADGVELRDSIRKVLQGLPDRQRLFLIWYFGLLGERPCTMRVIGQRLGLCESRVSQMWKELLPLLRRKADLPRLLAARESQLGFTVQRGGIMDTEHIRQFFDYAHLPAELQSVSRPFASLADQVLALPRNPERTVALRKLLEAKDAAVRAKLAKAV